MKYILRVIYIYIRIFYWILFVHNRLRNGIVYQNTKIKKSLITFVYQIFLDFTWGQYQLDCSVYISCTTFDGGTSRCLRLLYHLAFTALDHYLSSFVRGKQLLPPCRLTIRWRCCLISWWALLEMVSQLFRAQLAMWLIKMASNFLCWTLYILVSTAVSYYIFVWVVPAFKSI